MRGPTEKNTHFFQKRLDLFVGTLESCDGVAHLDVNFVNHLILSVEALQTGTESLWSLSASKITHGANVHRYLLEEHETL